MNVDHLHQEQQQRQMNSGLMRYRSAPSSLIANFVDGFGEGEGCDEFLPHRSSSPEAERMFARFMSCGNGDSISHNLMEIREKSQFMGAVEHQKEIGPQQNGYSSASQLMYQASSPPIMTTHGLVVSGSPVESSYSVMNSTAMDHSPQVKMGSGNCSNLIRHSSSPAGIFSHLNLANGYTVMRGMSDSGAGKVINGEVDGQTSRLNGQINFSSGPTSSSGLMSQISEIGSECIRSSSPDNGSLGNGNRYIPGFPIGSWDDSSNDNFTGLKRGDINSKMISGSSPLETQNGESGIHTPGLTHQFSFPRTSAEMATIKQFPQFQDSVPCKIRAKRGCATHPRSIAERVRRTRISERMRKLQELVPNMDKQTNTADMLHLAWEYIKDLQKQVKTLSDKRENCTCSSKQKPYSKPTTA